MCNAVLPRESDSEKIGRGGIRLVHFAFNYEHWQFRQETGVDRGKDCSFEYITDDNEFNNAVICGQVKATKSPDYYRLKNEECFSYGLERRTINYALRSNCAFLLFFCDLNNNSVYYLPIQEYFIMNEGAYDKLEEKNTGKLFLHIPLDNTVNTEDDEELVQLANTSYYFRNGRVYKTMNN